MPALPSASCLVPSYDGSQGRTGRRATFFCVAALGVVLLCFASGCGGGGAGSRAATGLPPPAPREARLRSAVRERAGDSGAWKALTRHLLDSGRPLDALDAVREGAAACPGDTELVALEARALVACGRPDDAAVVLRPLALQPGVARIQLADCLVRAGDWEAALSILRALPRQPAEAALPAARVALEALSPETALRVLRLDPSPASEVEALAGLALLRAGDYPAAVRALEAGVHLVPEAAEPRLLLGAALRLQGGRERAAQARADLSLAAAQAPDDGAAQYEAARCALELGDWPTARGLLERAAALEGGWAEVWHDLAAARQRTGEPVAAALARARYLQLAGDPAAGARLIGSIAARQPGDLDLQLAHADALFRAGDDLAARALLNRLREREPRNPRMLGTIFQAELKAQQYAPALAALDAQLAIEPANPSLVQARIEVLQLLYRYSDAERLLEQLRDQSPEDPSHRLWLGRSLALWSARTDRIAAAETELRTALRLASGNAEAHQELGALLRQAGRPREAVPHLRRALELHPENLETLRLLALSCAAAGDAARSAEWFAVHRRRRSREEELQRLDRALRAARPEPALRRRRAYLLLRAGRWPAALADFEALERGRHLAPADRRDLAALYAHARRFQRQAEVLGRRVGGGR